MRVIAVERHEPAEDSPIATFHLECPEPGLATNSFGLRIVGFVITRADPVEAVSATTAVCLPYLTRPVPRADVELAFPAVAPALISGFELTAVVPGRPGPQDVQLWVSVKGELVLLARIALELGALALGYRPAFRPLLVTCGGRVGGSAVMAAIASHPDVVAQGPIPFEEKPGLFWLHAARVLSSPSNFIDSEQRFGFEHEVFKVGFSPYHADDWIDPILRNVLRWHKDSAPLKLIEFAQQMTDSFYAALAADLRKPDAAVFAEKASIGLLPLIVHDVYPASREVFVVRDPRDMLVSILAFNEKRGFRDFHADKFTNVEEYVRYPH